MSEFIGTIEVLKKGTAKNGNEFGIVELKECEQHFSTFKPSMLEGLEEDMKVKIVYEKDKTGKYNNIISIESVDYLEIAQAHERCMNNRTKPNDIHLTIESVRIAALSEAGKKEQIDIEGQIKLAQRYEKYILEGV